MRCSMAGELYPSDYSLKVDSCNTNIHRFSNLGTNHSRWIFQMLFALHWNNYVHGSIEKVCYDLSILNLVKFTDPDLFQSVPSMVSTRRNGICIREGASHSRCKLVTFCHVTLVPLSQDQSLVIHK